MVCFLLSYRDFFVGLSHGYGELLRTALSLYGLLSNDEMMTLFGVTTGIQRSSPTIGRFVLSIQIFGPVTVVPHVFNMLRH